MVNLLAGPKGSGKTQKMMELANEQVKACKGNLVFLKNSHRDTRGVGFDIRVVCMDDIRLSIMLTNTSVSYMVCTAVILIWNAYSSTD